MRNSADNAVAANVGARCRFLQRDCEDTGLPADAFEAGLCNGMLHHLDLNRAFPELHRILAPGGRLVTVTFHSLEDRIVKQFLKERTTPEEQGSRHLPPVASSRPQPSFRFVNHRQVSPTAT